MSRTFDIRQNGQAFIDFRGVRDCKLEISSAWQDHVNIESEGYGELGQGNCDSFLTIEESVEDETIAIRCHEDRAINDKSAKIVKLTVPEMFNISIFAQGIQLELKNKIQGDFSLECSSGRISIDKLRGLNLQFSCGSADLTIKKLLEGNMHVRANRVSGKMVNGDIVDIKCKDSIDIEAMYAKESTLVANGDVTVGLMHGATEVSSAEGDVKMSGIDGSFDILAEKGHIVLQLNKLNSNNVSSIATAKKGGITANVDPELATRVYMKCLSAETTKANVSVISDAFLHDDSNKDEPGKPSVRGEVVGTLSGLSKLLKRPTFSKSNSSGKIDSHGADEQSLNTFSIPGVVAANGNDESQLTEKLGGGPEKFGLQLISFGNIRLETLSWIEAIRRKHGFSNNEGTAPPKKVGRTASAKENAKKLLAKGETL